MKTPEDYFFIGLILLEEFVKRILISPIKLLVMYDEWSHNNSERPLGSSLTSIASDNSNTAVTLASFTLNTLET